MKFSRAMRRLISRSLTNICILAYKKWHNIRLSLTEYHSSRRCLGRLPDRHTQREPGMGDVVEFPTVRPDEARAPEPDALVGAAAEGLATIRGAIARLDAVKPVLAAGERRLSAAIDRLGAQRDRLMRRTEISRAIERAADQLGAVIESGDLAAAELLVPAFEALVRAAASDHAPFTLLDAVPAPEPRSIELSAAEA
jgi:hypothetical protein